MNQLAISTPQLLEKLKADFATHVREFPDASCPFLRFQVGVNVERPERIPIYEGRGLKGHQHTGRNLSKFKLLGFGSTLEAAHAMARRAK